MTFSRARRSRPSRSATPAATYFDLVRSALEAGKHVMVEKPLTPTAAEREKLAKLARRSGLVPMCDHTSCYTPAMRRIRELIRGGKIGEAQFVDSVRINLGLVQPDVDVLWDLAPHDLSILNFVLPSGFGRQTAKCAYLGAGALVCEDRTIGTRALVGMEAVVTQDIPPGELWAGVPARYIRRAPAETLPVGADS